MSNDIVKNNSDFLFIYEGTKTNPNGDPDMENKPRMDYDTKTNLVTDLRIKRNIREYLKDSGEKIFVDTLAEKKVTTDKMLNSIVDDVTKNNNELNKLFEKNSELKKQWDDLAKLIDTKDNIYSKSKEIFKKKQPTDDEKKIKEKFPALNNLLLEEIIKQNLIDIRMFGGAFAVEGFSRTYTGPIQLNWGYSMHPVEMIKSNTIVTIMNDDASTMGKDYRLYYSLIAFHGTINKHQAQKTGLKIEDIQAFREAIIKSVSYKPTRSKSDQYPMLYMELEYIDNYNGYLRDLRDFVACTPCKQQIRSINDLKIDLTKIEALIGKNKEIIKSIHLWKTSLQQTGFDDFVDKIKGNADLQLEELSFDTKKE